MLLTTPPHYREPFAAWGSMAPGGSPQTPQWWTAINKLKHDRLRKAEMATLDVALDALSALVLSVATTREMRPAQLRREWLQRRGFNPEHIIDLDDDGMGHHGITVETRLFLVPFRMQPALPANAADYSPAAHGGSPRMSSFFGRM